MGGGCQEIEGCGVEFVFSHLNDYFLTLSFIFKDLFHSEMYC